MISLYGHSDICAQRKHGVRCDQNLDGTSGRLRYSGVRPIIKPARNTTSVGQYLKVGQLPVRFPLYIAMVSIARDVILRAGANTELHLVASAGAIVLIAIGVLLIRYGQSRYPSKPDERRDESAR